MAKFCSNCGHELNEGDNFSSECATSVGGVAPDAAQGSVMAQDTPAPNTVIPPTETTYINYTDRITSCLLQRQITRLT